MGNSNIVPSTDEPDNNLDQIFDKLGGSTKRYLTLKDLVDSPCTNFTTPRSLPALYFFDLNKDGNIAPEEFRQLIHFFQEEKSKVETAMKHDKALRDLIHRASKAGVKDCSVHGRSSYRRFSSFRNVRSVFSKSPDPHALQLCEEPVPAPNASADTNPPLSSSPSDQSQHVPSRASIESAPLPRDESQQHYSGESPLSSEAEYQHTEVHPHHSRLPTISMFSSQQEFESVPARHQNPLLNDSESSQLDADQDPQNRTAIDAAVLENIMHTNIHKLADLLHDEGCREQFMAWLWKLVNFNGNGVVTIDELRVFLEALKEDSIDLQELVFYREPQATLEESVINEFDTTHAGMLSRDEFMVLADLVTREYEFWENRHLERVGNYELGRTIGRGSSGVVRHAMHVETREKVAIKIIKKGKCSDLSRLDREIQSLMHAEHKNIVALDEVLESENNLHIVMELCGGGSMVDIVRLYPEERMPEETARFFIRQVFEALAFCHDIGVCHRDVRLDNLMLDNTGNVKITDFGHSGIFTPGWDMFSTALVGSVFNLSPEQIMGQVYSGEKIDVWSAGVALYCLLVGRPPFYEPEVNSLMERILACDFETPDFLSDSATDIIRCMVRAKPADRIPLKQVLHHPWFYDGPEFGPSMNVVVIPVDRFFVKRPDIAEMIMAMTIYQHHLHFHLADTQNPRAAPQSLRGQDWTLKCLCPRNDIKFTVALFTSKPGTYRRRRKNVQLTSPVSLSTLTEPAVMKDLALANPGTSVQIPLVRKRSDIRNSAAKNASFDTDLAKGGGSLPGGSLPPAAMSSENLVESRPARRRPFQITPMDIAAHLRQGGEMDFSSFGIGKILDLSNERRKSEQTGRGRHDIAGSSQAEKPNPSGSGDVDSLGLGKGRWTAFDNASSGNLTRLNRSATVDAFPYQKVYPKRKMPESVRKLKFDLPQSPSQNALEYSGSESEVDNEDNNRLIRHSASTAACTEEPISRGTASSACCTDQEIAQKLCRRPSKALSPQTPQISIVPSVRTNEAVDTVGAGSGDGNGAASSPANNKEEEINKGESASGSGAGGSSDISRGAAESGDIPNGRMDRVSWRVPPGSEFQPFIEVRLQSGESGLFLKICRTLKTICTTKLKAAAEQKKETKKKGRRTLSALRRTASGRSMESDVTAD